MVSVTSVHTDSGAALYIEVVTLMASVLLPRDFFWKYLCFLASCTWRLSRRRANTSQPVAPEGRSEAELAAKDALGRQ